MNEDSDICKRDYTDCSRIELHIVYLAYFPKNVALHLTIETISGHLEKTRNVKNKIIVIW